MFDKIVKNDSDFEGKLREALENAPMEIVDDEDTDYDNSGVRFIPSNMITLDTSTIMNMTIDPELFKKGVVGVSELCGGIAALCSVGITPNAAMEFLTDKMAAHDAMAHNLEMAHIQAEAAVESSKYETASLQKQMI